MRVVLRVVLEGRKASMVFTTFLDFFCRSKLFTQIKKIEDYIDLGQIEEVIEMVKDEIELSEAYVGMFGH